MPHQRRYIRFDGGAPRSRRHSALIQAQARAETIQQAVRPPMNLDGHRLVCTLSIGVTLYLGNVVASEVLLRRAELAMNESKNSGRDRLYFS
ncbi:hypothetical protein DK184_13445 [Pseudomonas sp. RW405]|nr:hypothetical protein DK184_13445 [Pseudomonas sp. RW405]